jgi:hypothetical protein
MICVGSFRDQARMFTLRLGLANLAAKALAAG